MLFLSGVALQKLKLYTFQFPFISFRQITTKLFQIFFCLLGEAKYLVDTKWWNNMVKPIKGDGTYLPYLQVKCSDTNINGSLSVPVWSMVCLSQMSRQRNSDGCMWHLFLLWGTYVRTKGFLFYSFHKVCLTELCLYMP